MGVTAALPTPGRTGPLGRGLTGLRRFLAVQNRLWAGYLASLQPWEHEGELRWVRDPLTRRWVLRGDVLPDRLP